MVFLIHGKEKAKISCSIDLSYACLNKVGSVEGLLVFRKKNTNVWYQAVSIWKTTRAIVKVNMAT